MSTNTHVIDADIIRVNDKEVLGEPLTREDITPGTWLFIRSNLQIQFVGFVLRGLETDDIGTFFIGVCYTPHGTAYTTRWYLTDAGIEPDPLPRPSANRAYALPDTISPFDYDAMVGLIMTRWLRDIARHGTTLEPMHALVSSH